MLKLHALHYRSLLSCTGRNQLISRSKYTYPKIPPEDEKHIIRSPYSEVQIPEINLADYVWQNVNKWPENVALVSSYRYLILAKDIIYFINLAGS